MPKLNLSAVCVHTYQTNLACAYIHYGSEEKPLDHKGSPIGADGEIPLEFMSHLQRSVLPSLQSAFTDTVFKVDGVESIQGSHPFITIQRKDGKNITNNDLQFMSTKLKFELTYLNQSSNMFTKKHMHRVIEEDMNHEKKLGSKMHK